MDTRLLVIILIVSQVFASDNKTNTEKTDLKVENNNRILSRQSGNALITFEEQAKPTQVDDTDYPNSNDFVTFENQPSNRPFRFANNQYDSNQNSHKGFDKQPVDFQEFNTQNPGFNQDVGSQGYGLYKPGRFGNQDPNDGTNNPDVHPGFGKLNPTIDINNPEGQSGYGLVFQDDNNIEVNNQVNAGQKKKRRRRRRKPKQLPGSGYGFPLPGVGSFGTGVPIRPGPYPAPFSSGQLYRPPRRRPSVAEEALTSITTALTSIARYDDLQCVPRLLCEVAGGQNPVTGSGGSASGSGILQTIMNLQPLVTLLAAYNGVSTSPLFVFGRAALLGITSKGNAGTCRYAYSQCPTDPEKLVEYLNNHNGGFFRFFSNPQPYGQQNLEQFYGHLAGNYGLYRPQGNTGQNGYPSQSFGGNPDLNLGGYPNLNVGGVDLYQQLATQYPGQNGQGGFDYPGQNHGNGFQNPSGQYSNQFGGVHQNPSLNQGNGFENAFSGLNYGLYQGNQQTYGFNYPYKQEQFKSAAENKDEKNKIEKRIQNRPDIIYVGGEHSFNQKHNTKWAFPDNNRNEIIKNKPRFGRTVVFPGKEDTSSQSYKEHNIETTYVQQNIDSNKKAKGFNFPENQSNRQYVDYYNYPPYTQILDYNKFKLDQHGFYVESDEEPDHFDKEFKGNEQNEDDVEIVYVLRGNGDPNKPEIVKLKPGQKL